MAIGKCVLGVIAGATVFAAAGEASATESVLRGCVTPLNNGQIGAYRFPAGTGGVFKAPVPANPGPDMCANFTWVYSETRSPNFMVMPQWAGPVPSKCDHAQIEYGVYYWNGSWKYAGGGQLWGTPASTGGCTYSVKYYPEVSYGADMTKVRVLPWGYYMVAVKTAAHNHSGNDCSGGTCYWPTNLIFARY